MRKLLICLFLLSASALAQNSLDYAKSGNEFLAVCDQSSGASIENFECTSYVEGVSAGLELGFQLQFLKNHPAENEAPSIYCFPANATTGQSVQIVVQFIKAHPKDAHRQTRLLIFEALMDAFPCPATTQATPTHP